MYKARLAARVDSNQNAIVDALREIPGVSVEPGHDDLLVGFKGQTFWFEVKRQDLISKKTGNLIPSAKRDSQKKLESEWAGHYRVVTCIDEILADLGLLS